MKRTLLSTLVITSTLGLSTNVFALGMGELELKSTLNQPLQAEIVLTNIADLTEWEIKPSLASDGDFDRAGVEKVFFLSDIDFSIKGNRIILTSDKSVTEPFLNFLVQVNWPSGRVLREYTLLLDPPVFDDQIQPLAAQVAPKKIETKAVAAAKKAPENRWETEDAAPGTYKVQKDDTLWEIAINTRPSRKVSPQQMMLAIQDSNPGAFINGNINRLKTHQVLRIPNQEQIAARNDSQAVNEVMRQNQELQSAGAQIDATANAAQSNKAEQLTDGGELKLLAKQSQVAESAGASGDVESGGVGNGREESIQNDLAIALETLDTTKLENNDLRERLASLEEQIATLQRLVSLKDDQLASIQTLELQKEAQANDDATAEVVPDEAAIETEQDYNNLADSDVAADIDSAAADTAELDVDATELDVDAAEVDGTADTAADGVTDFNYSEPAPETTNELAVEEVDPELAAAQAQLQAEERYKPKGFFAEVMAKPSLMAGIAGGIALLLALIGLGIKKRRDAKEGEIEDPSLAGFDENFEFSEGELDESSLDDFEFDEDDQSLAGHNELNDDLLEGLSGSNEEAVDETDEASDTVAQTADIIGEAEIYIAYGRFDQAADLLKNSIALEPSRIDLRMKLLEVYLETDDATSFAEAELDLNSIGDLEANEKAVAMRSRLSSPISGVDESLMDEDLVVAEDDLDIDMEALADSDDDFAGGLDFDAALDLTESDNAEDDFSRSLDALEEDAPDLTARLQATDAIGRDTVNVDVKDEGDVDENFDIEFNLDDTDALPVLSDVSEESADDLSLDDLSLDDIPTLDATEDGLEGLESLEDLDGIDDIPTLEANLDEDLESSIDDLDLAELDDVDVVSNEENPDSEDAFVDLAAMGRDDTSSEIDALESLLDSDSDVEGLPDFELDETGFESDSDADLQALEADLANLAMDETADKAESEQASLTLEESNAVTPSELDEVLDFETNSEFDLNELEDLPDFTADADLTERGSDKAPAQEIDLDQLAAADDEFDFLAGTDECATKLDLARAYLDMEDSEGAKDLLQEVIAEGSDQQKHDARALMDSIG